MKMFLLLAVFAFGLSAQAETCKKADIKDCAKVLKSKEATAEFIQTYEDVCRENKTFKCLKRTVRGSVKDEMKYMKEEFPRAYFFTTKDGAEDKVFVLDKK